MEFFRENIAYCIGRKLNIEEGSYYNLLHALVSDGQYREAVQLFEQNLHLFQSEFAQHYGSRILKAVSHLFLDEPEKAVQCIPAELRSIQPEQNIEFRLVQARAFYLYDRVEDSRREMQNRERMARKQDMGYGDGEIDHTRLIGWYSRFFKAQAMLKEQKKGTMQELKQEAAKFRTSLPLLLRRYYFLEWLLQ